MLKFVRTIASQSRPVRSKIPTYSGDEIWVYNKTAAPFICAEGTGFGWMLDEPKKHPRNHIAYQPVGRHGLRHAALLAAPFSTHILSLRDSYDRSVNVLIKQYLNKLTEIHSFKRKTFLIKRTPKIGF